MPANQSQRPKFYEEQYLGAADLTAAVDYGRIQQARHALSAHTWGIAIGLQLKETPQAGGGVSVHLLPGYAWDGYGRPIVVLSPYKIPEEKFSVFKFDPNIDTDGKGRRIKLWLRYDESATQNPRPGFEVCDPTDQRSRIQETFRIEISQQELGVTDRYSGVTIAAKALTDAKTALKAFDQEAPLVYDESVPHQTFPEPQDRARWLIPIGYVRWLPVQNQPGHFIARDDSGAGGAKKDSDEIRRVRRYIGVVTEEIEAADGAIRLRDRGKDPMSNFQWPTVDQITQSTNDLVWVEGNLRVIGNTKLCAGNLDFRDQQGQDLNVPLRIQRTEDAILSVSALQVTLGSDSSKDHRFAIGPLKDGPVPGQKIVDEKFAVLSSGRVGIGTLTPNRALTIESNTGTYLNVRSTLGGGPFEVLLGTDTSGGIVSTMTNHDLQLRAGGNDPKLIIKADGNVGIGIGTTTPYAKLTLNGSLGFTNNASPMMYIFESGTNNPEKAVVAHSRDFSDWGLFYKDSYPDQMIFKANGSPVMTVDLQNRNVSIGTMTPGSTLDVNGDLRISGTARKPGGGSWTDYSDERLKKEIAPLADALSRLLQLRGVRFEWREPKQMGNLTGPQAGLIAQEVETVFPEWVSTGPDGYKELTIRGFEALTIEALRELHAEIEQLKARLATSSGNQPTSGTRRRRQES
jgi:hypothetical protein